jgi:acyl dehydratase
MPATLETPVGTPMPEYRVHSKNLSNRPDRDFEANVHDDQTAQRLGFKRGLVAGGQTMSWMSRILVDFFGENMFKSGRIQCTYVSPVFDDDDVVAGGVVRERVEEDGGVRLVCDIWLEKADGTKAIAGTASALIS